MRVLQVGFGDLGRRIARDVEASGLARIVGVVDASNALAGRELSEFLADPSFEGRRIVGDLDAFHEDADAALVLTSSHLPECMPTLRATARRVPVVVSTCEELTWPRLRHPDLADELDRLARETGCRIVGTGVNPGLLMDALPTLVGAACLSVSAVRVERTIDAARRRESFQRKVGAGEDVADVEAGLRAGTRGHVGLAESLHALAHHVGLGLESWEESAAPVVATDDMQLEREGVPAGRCAGVRQVARGLCDGRVVAELVFEAFVGAPRPRDRIVLDAEPPVELVIEGGVQGDAATSAIVLHALAAAEAAPPGLHSTVTLPLLARRR